MKDVNYLGWSSRRVWFLWIISSKLGIDFQKKLPNIKIQEKTRVKRRD